MSTKEIVEFETSELAAGHRDVMHLHHEGSFLRAYEWSAFLACRYLHDFKVTKRVLLLIVIGCERKNALKIWRV